MNPIFAKIQARALEKTAVLVFNFCPNTTDPQLVCVSSKDDGQREFHCCTSSYGQSDSDNSPVKGHIYFGAVSWPAEKTSLVDEG